MITRVRQLARDATLRHWLWARATGQTRGPAAFIPHRPPYLKNAPTANNGSTRVFSPCDRSAPQTNLILDLPGECVEIFPCDPGRIFEKSFIDTETLLALHRFAWIPSAGRDLDPAWVIALWGVWREKFNTPDNSWPWHPYTAAERAINILHFARRHGLPTPTEQTRDLLARHAPVILSRLEYFGEHGTGNHLSNNGRGLFILGLELNMPDYADIGARIMIEESRRIFLPSGMLREGSTHYHLLLARNYAEAWLTARRYGHECTGPLEKILCRILAVVPHLNLLGGMPLVGDISPDCPPEHLAAFFPDNSAQTGWGALLDEEDRSAFLRLKAKTVIADPIALVADGWLRHKSGDWDGLWHLPSGGWSPMPGHGHQDAGSFELHWRSLPLFVDLGRGAYGESASAAYYPSALAHNGLTLNDADPYPPNKPYYSEDFRRKEGGGDAGLAAENDGVSVFFGGYDRLGARRVVRRWRFAANSFAIQDNIEGHGRGCIARRLNTPWPATILGNAALIQTSAGTVRVQAEKAAPTLSAATRWTAYGQGTTANAIAFVLTAPLPWTGTITVAPV